MPKRKRNVNNENSKKNVKENDDVIYDDRLDLFDDEKSLVEYREIQERLEVELLPQAPPNNTPTIEFLIPADLDYLLDFIEPRLRIKGRVVKANGNDLDETDVVTPTNNFGSCLFSQIELSINGCLITTASNLYPYKCYFENLLNFDDELIKSKGLLQGFIPDVNGVNDVYAPNADGCTTASKNLNANIALSKNYNMIVPLHLDLSRCGKFMPNLIQTRLKLIRSKPEFYLNYDPLKGGYQFKIDDIVLLYNKYRPDNAILYQYAKLLERPMPFGQFSFAFPDIRVGSHSIAKDSLSFVLNNPFNGKVPYTLVCAFVTHEALNGTPDKNPFNFQHCSLKDLTATVDSKITQCGIKNFDFANDDFIEGYMSILNNVDAGTASTPAPIITRQNYAKGYTVLVFDFTDNNAGSDLTQPNQSGVLKLNGHFTVKLAENMQMIYYGVFSQKMYINRNRQVSIVNSNA